VQGHLLSVDGDALITTWPLLDFWHLCLTFSDLSYDQFLKDDVLACVET
jgi:hypothetical protein